MLLNSGLPGCCGMNVLYNFNGIASQDAAWSIPMLAKELRYKARYDGEDKPMLQPVVIFSHSDSQDTHRWNPRGFADWLRTQGERVNETRSYKHDRHGTRIIGFMWHPSAPFRAAYEKECSAHSSGVIKE